MGPSPSPINARHIGRLAGDRADGCHVTIIQQHIRPFGVIFKALIGCYERRVARKLIELPAARLPLPRAAKRRFDLLIGGVGGTIGMFGIRGQKRTTSWVPISPIKAVAAEN